MSLTEIEERGQARMPDVGEKPVTRREALARGWVVMKPETLALIRTGGLPKGDALSTARLAGIMAAKRTPDLLPLSHPLLLDSARVECRPDDAANAVEITAAVHASGRSGPEMQALTAVCVAALTIYDMCSAADRSVHIESVRLLRRAGGQSGTWELGEEEVAGERAY